MGTRGLSGFQHKGTTYLAYSQYDSYPSGLGLEMLALLRSHLGPDENDHYQFDPDFLAKLAELEVIDEREDPTPEQLARLRRNLGNERMLWQDVSTGNDWYSWLRGAQGNSEAYLRAGFFPDSASFGRDSLFCENVYVINIDERTLDYYEGFNKPEVEGDHLKAETEGIWAGIELPVTEEITRSDGSKFTRRNEYGVCIRTVQFPFDEIPELTEREFIKRIQIAPRARHRADHIDDDGNYSEESLDR